MSELVVDPSLGAEPAAPPAEPVVEPAAEPAAEPEAVVAEPAAEPEAVAEPAPEEKPKGGMLADLIATRERAKKAETALKSLQPVLDRLTPDIAQAIQEGRVVVRPPQSQPDAERERLTQVAQDLGLFKTDNSPDLEAAARVDKYVRGTVSGVMQQKVAPLEAMTLEDRANKTIAEVWSRTMVNVGEEAAAIVRAEFADAMGQQNARHLLSQREIVETVIERGLGKAVLAGKLSSPAPAPKKAAQPAAIITETGGRRAPASAAIQLSPKLQEVYRNAGLDPAKGAFNSELKVDPKTGGVQLED